MSGLSGLGRGRGRTRKRHRAGAPRLPGSGRVSGLWCASLGGNSWRVDRGFAREPRCAGPCGSAAVPG